MRLVSVIAAACCAGAALVGQPTPAAGPDQATRPAPVFRSSVDVVQLDVSVLDKKRGAVRGLSAADFRVVENGDSQPIVDVTEVALPDSAHAGAAWLHLVPPDVEANTLGDRLAGGQVVVIAFDDVHLPLAAPGLVGRAREIAYSVVDRLSGIDQAAIFSTQMGMTERFTNDPDRLRAAIAGFRPHSPTVGKAPCEHEDPTIPALLTLSQSLAQIPQRRKTVILISTGDSLPFIRPATGCASLLSQLATSLFWQAQRANINIQTFDPGGEASPIGAGGGRGRRPGNPDSGASVSAGGGSAGGGIDTAGSDRGGGYRFAGGSESSGVGGADRGGPARAGGRAIVTGANSLAMIADGTGGTSVTRASEFSASLDRLFEANRSYYLVSYRTSHSAPDGKYRRIAVSVKRPGTTALARRGYFGASVESGKASPDSPERIMAAEASRMGVATGGELAMRASVAPFAAPDSDGPSAVTALVVTLGVRPFVPRAPVTDRLDVLTSVEGAFGPPIAPVRQSFLLRLTPDVTADGRYEISWRLDLPPGRQTIRLNAHSALADTNGTVYVEVDVPDLRKPAIALSGLVFTQALAGRSVIDWMLTGLLPAPPTTARQFTRGEIASIYCRAYERGQLAPLALTLQVLGAGDDDIEFSVGQTLGVERFDAGHTAEDPFDVPTERLRSGMHLLDLHALLPDGSSARRMAPFVIK